MVNTMPDLAPLESLATGVAWLDAGLRIEWSNAAFSEHTGFSWSRLKARTLVVLQPGGTQLHELAHAAQRDAVACTLAGATVCAAPARDVRLDFAFTPCAGGVLVEVHPAPATSDAPKLSESLRGFAHEVRNPLAAISGAAQLLQRHANGARQTELAQLIRDEATRLAALTERLLGARDAMTTRTLNVHALLERAAEMLEAAHMPVTIARDYDPSLPAWHGDPDRLLQAVINLTRNAIEANARRIVLRSRAEAGWRDARGQRVPALRIEVEDDGDGVPDAIAQSLFEPMVSGRADGTGLGLALAREIAREHGGELTWSPRATGTCFILLLPRHQRSGESE